MLRNPWCTFRNTTSCSQLLLFPSQQPRKEPGCVSHHLIATWVILEWCRSHQSKWITPLPSFFSFEGPVLAAEGPGQSPTSPSPQLEEMEPGLLELEQDPPNWRELASPEALSSLGKKETKRQEVINGEEKERWSNVCGWNWLSFSFRVFSFSPFQSCLLLSMPMYGC